jgi:DNA-binding beta-propeller fold protein YncE
VSSRAALVVAGSVLLIAGCSGGGSDHARRVGTPACLSPGPAAPPLAHVPTATVAIPGQPYSVVASRDGRWSFASLPDAIALMSNRDFAPRLVRVIRLPAAVAAGQHGLALTPNGRYLLASAASGAVVIDAVRAERGLGGAVLGRLVSTVPGVESNAGASAVVTARDGRYAFVARERAGSVAVFNLAAALATRLHSSGYVGPIPVGIGPVAVALSPSGRRLYAASLAVALRPAATVSRGTLSVIDAPLAERRPWRSVLQTVSAGCEPVGLVTSSHGRFVWVTSLADHSVLGFASARLVNDPAHALMAVVRVGDTPIGLLPFAGGSRLLVADSGRSAGSLRAPGVTVIDTTRALAGRVAVLGSIATGLDPRQLALVPRRATALVTNYGSKQVEAVDLAAVP